MKKTSNPLTIIGIFAGIAEVAGTIVLPTLSSDIQRLFLWYVMGFPVLLVILFFFTLHRKPWYLYAPSDFSNEENYMALQELRNARKQIQQLVEDKPALEIDLKPLQSTITNALKSCFPIELKLTDIESSVIESISEFPGTTIDDLVTHLPHNDTATLLYTINSFLGTGIISERKDDSGLSRYYSGKYKRIKENTFRFLSSAFEDNIV